MLLYSQFIVIKWECTLVHGIYQINLEIHIIPSLSVETKSQIIGIKNLQQSYNRDIFLMQGQCTQYVSHDV